MIKKLGLLLALLIIGSFASQGAFAASWGFTALKEGSYPACYHGYGATDPLYNGTNGDQATYAGWCIDGNGVLQPNNIMVKSSTQPVTQGGYAVPIVNFNYSTTALPNYAALSTFDALLAQQTGSIIVDYGGQPLVPTQTTMDTLSGIGAHYVLPPASPGEQFTITSASKSVITVDALTVGLATNESLTLTTNDTIEYAPGGTGLALGYSIKSPGGAGDSITLVATYPGVWVVTDMVGVSPSPGVTTDTLWSTNTTSQ